MTDTEWLEKAAVILGNLSRRLDDFAANPGNEAQARALIIDSLAEAFTAVQSLDSLRLN